MEMMIKAIKTLAEKMKLRLILLSTKVVMKKQIKQKFLKNQKIFQKIKYLINSKWLLMGEKIEDKFPSTKIF